jgi:hypothetical protein
MSDPTSDLTSGTARPRWRAAAIVVALALALLTPLVVRVAIDGRAELRLADEAAAAGDLDGQILHLGRAARFRLPLAGHDELALAQLRDLARSADEAEEIELALAAWRELRGALIGTRVVEISDPEALREANAAIVDLMAREAEARGNPPDRERWAAELDEDLAPRGRTLFAATCFVAWLGACLGFFTRGIDGKGRLVPQPALRWGGSTLVLLIAWLLLM